MPTASARCFARSAVNPWASHQSDNFTRAAGSCPAFARTASYSFRSAARAPEPSSAAKAERTTAKSVTWNMDQLP